jgi:hypothetical protein
MIYSPLQGRLAQRESAAFTRQRSLVRTQHRPPRNTYKCWESRTSDFRVGGCLLRTYGNAAGSRGTGISNSLQILRAVRLSNSVCRGTLVRLPVLVFW